MRRIYKVAEHRFCLDMADDDVMWSLLGNYEPFELREDVTDSAEVCVQSGSSEVLFSLSVDEGQSALYRSAEAVHILTDSSDDDMPRIELYEQNAGYLFRVAPLKDAAVCCEMLVNKSFSSARLVLLPGYSSRLGRFPVDNAMMLLYAFSTACMETLEMHASVVVKENKAYLFLGKSGTGKSTHSRQWLSLFSDARLLNDDNPIVRYDADSALWRAYGSPWSGKTPCYNNADAPVGAFVLIKQAPHNVCMPLALPEAYAAVYSSASGLRCNRQMADGLHNAVAKLVTTVPCYILECLPDTDAAQVCYDFCS